MQASNFVDRNDIRAGFSRAMSAMYKAEVPLYGTLLDLVAAANAAGVREGAKGVRHASDPARLGLERHGAIRVGTADELAVLGRLFAVMGMQPVGYYDLAPAGVPVHATAFRPVHEASLQVSPFRVFTSLLRLELIDDTALRGFAQATLARRRIFTPRLLALVDRAEQQGGLGPAEADEFVMQALETFRWHPAATVSLADYRRLAAQHRLVADVVAFQGPHINHLTPRTLDIDAVQAGMRGRGITPKAVIEGPPRRACPILLRQTSFKALEERIRFTGQADGEFGSHAARFGEVEQRGAALTPRGRQLYDRLMHAARDELGGPSTEANAARYAEILARTFQAFPDSEDELRTQGLAYFRYFPTARGIEAARRRAVPSSIEQLIATGHVRCEPLVYEDFLPVSAAGIFQSNLGDGAQARYRTVSSRAAFEQALGCKTLDESALYAHTQRRSLDDCAAVLGLQGYSPEDDVR